MDLMDLQESTMDLAAEQAVPPAPVCPIDTTRSPSDPELLLHMSDGKEDEEEETESSSEADVEDELQEPSAITEDKKEPRTSTGSGGAGQFERISEEEKGSEESALESNGQAKRGDLSKTPSGESSGRTSRPSLQRMSAVIEDKDKIITPETKKESPPQKEKEPEKKEAEPAEGKKEPLHDPRFGDVETEEYARVKEGMQNILQTFAEKAEVAPTEKETATTAAPAPTPTPVTSTIKSPGGREWTMGQISPSKVKPLLPLKPNPERLLPIGPSPRESSPKPVVLKSVIHPGERYHRKSGHKKKITGGEHAKSPTEQRIPSVERLLPIGPIPDRDRSKSPHPNTSRRVLSPEASLLPGSTVSSGTSGFPAASSASAVSPVFFDPLPTDDPPPKPPRLHQRLAMMQQQEQQQVSLTDPSLLPPPPPQSLLETTVTTAPSPRQEVSSTVTTTVTTTCTTTSTGGGGIVDIPLEGVTIESPSVTTASHHPPPPPNPIRSTTVMKAAEELSFLEKGPEENSTLDPVTRVTAKIIDREGKTSDKGNEADQEGKKKMKKKKGGKSPSKKHKEEKQQEIDLSLSSGGQGHKGTISASIKSQTAPSSVNSGGSAPDSETEMSSRKKMAGIQDSSSQATTTRGLSRTTANEAGGGSASADEGHLQQSSAGGTPKPGRQYKQRRQRKTGQKDTGGQGYLESQRSIDSKASGGVAAGVQRRQARKTESSGSATGTVSASSIKRSSLSQGGDGSGGGPPPQSATPGGVPPSSSMIIHDELLTNEKCPRCGHVVEEFSEEEVGMCIVILRTYVHRESGLAAPILPDILKLVSRFASYVPYNWQSER